MNEYFESVKKYMSKIIPIAPKHITEEWLIDALKNEDFLRWGFTFEDLSNCTFGNISEKTLRKINISTYTKLPQKHPFNLDFNNYIDKDIQEAHNLGITGKNVNIAIIDQGFVPIHEELKQCLKDYKDYQANSHSFHGTIVASSLAGKNLGVAPDANIFFYGHREANKDFICEDTIKALKDIYQRNLNGANIKIINISGYAHTLSSEFETIRDKLKSQGCYIIDSPTFGEICTCINQRNKDEKTSYYFSEWQTKTSTHLEKLKSKIAVPFTGLMPLWNTAHDYQIGGDVSYSWAIPRLSGIFALCLQLKPDMTLDQFQELIVETKTITEDGISIINPKDMLVKLQSDLKENKKL